MIQFRDRDRHARTPARETAVACLEAGIAAALPEHVVAETVELDGETLRIQDREYDLDAYDRIVVLGGGKAAGGLAAALEGRLGDRFDDGVVVSTGVPDLDRVDTPGLDRDNTSGRDRAGAPDSDRITVIEGDHPTPTDRNVDATGRVLDLADDADGETLVLAVVTGGGSALLCAPATGLSLADLRRTTDLLLDSGASIDEVNAVRKRCSAVKGGRLARAAAPATVVTLAISDVVGDDPTVIASGPTVPDPSTVEDARAVLERYELADRMPDRVQKRIENDGDDRESTERTSTGDADDLPNGLQRYHCLASVRTAIDAAVEVAADRGYEAMVLSSRIRGEAREAGTVHAAVAEEIRETGEPVEPPAVVLSGGEVTTTVHGDGIGGPNQELALAAGIAFASEGTDAVLASVDTDGIDGPTDAAGAVVDRETVTDVAAARSALAENDAGGYLAGRAALLETGSTGTNVNDLRVVVVGGERDA